MGTERAAAKARRRRSALLLVAAVALAVAVFALLPKGIPTPPSAVPEGADRTSGSAGSPLPAEDPGTVGPGGGAGGPAAVPEEEPSRMQERGPGPASPRPGMEDSPPGRADENRPVSAPPLEPPSAAPPPAPPPDAAARQLAELEALAARAAEHEAAEAWPQAVTAYEAALRIEPTATFAREGARRAAARVELARRLEDHLAHPQRLAAEPVLEEAREALDLAAEVAAPGPRHRRQVEALARLVATAATPVPVELVSDGETEVVVYQVGRLGRFTRRELELRPGEYTVVGSRRGYRDVRLLLRVDAAAAPARLTVTCREEV